MLIGACIWAWKATERPPYAFMEGSRLWFVGETWSPSDDVLVEYTSRKPFEELVDAANREVPRRWEVTRDENGRLTRAYTAAFDLNLSRADYLDRSSYPPIPEDVTTIITIERLATPLDRIRLWIYGLRWK